MNVIEVWGNVMIDVLHRVEAMPCMECRATGDAGKDNRPLLC